MSKFLDDLKQYYFDRDEFNKIFYIIFTDEEILQIELGCGGTFESWRISIV